MIRLRVTPSESLTRSRQLAVQKENRFTTCLGIGETGDGLPPDVLDTESARGHPRPVLFHL